MENLAVSDETIIAAKIAMDQKGMNYTGAGGKKSLAAVINKNPVFVACAINGIHRPNADDRNALAGALGLNATQKAEYERYPRRNFSRFPNDPFTYRLMEILANYGGPLTEIVNELFGDFVLPGDKPGRGGDGILSAIDFSFHVFRRTEGAKLPDFAIAEADPKINNRCTLVLDGKWLNFKAF